MRFIIFIAFCFWLIDVRAQLVLPGDFPDPSVVKINNTYWASATSSNWAPAFPLLESTDLVHWQPRGYVFDKLPDWADYYFWAPEITYDNKKVFIYYAAHKIGGSLCVAVASADKPEGPYQDLGPLVCEPSGSIDGFPMRDNDGRLYLIWKEDGNSINQPTPIWAMEMKEDRTGLVGDKVELFRNDASWEGNLVEGVSIIKHGDYFYAFYAGAACCGRGCNYATGVARSKNLLGPWEKFRGNPVLTGSSEWKCPGHGTVVVKDNRYYFLHHAYNEKGNVYTGRQGFLLEFIFTEDGWIKFLEPPDELKKITSRKISDTFEDEKLSMQWQWSVKEKPDIRVDNGQLIIEAQPDIGGAFIGQKVYTSDYNVKVTYKVSVSNAAGGLAIIGDEKNMIGVSVASGKLKVWKTENGNETYLPERKISLKKQLRLKMRVRDNKDVTFYSSTGFLYKKLNKDPIDGFYLPPWDRGVRVGLFSKGSEQQHAVFDDFVINNKF